MIVPAKLNFSWTFSSSWKISSYISCITPYTMIKKEEEKKKWS
jgi:hypothetical protein